MIYRQCSFWKLTQYSEGNSVLHATAAKTNGFLSRDTYVSSTLLNRHMWTKESLSAHWKTEVSGSILSTTIEFSQGIKVLDSATSHVDSFFGEIHVFLQLSWIGLCGAKRADLHPEKRKIQEVFLSKLTHILQGNKVLHVPASNTNGFLQGIHLFFHISWIGWFGIKWAFLHLESYDLQDLFLSKTNSFLTGKQWARCYCFYHKWLSFKMFMCFIN
jgi:hypothetical protein